MLTILSPTVAAAFQQLSFAWRFFSLCYESCHRRIPLDTKLKRLVEYHATSLAISFIFFILFFFWLLLSADVRLSLPSVE